MRSLKIDRLPLFVSCVFSCGMAILAVGSGDTSSESNGSSSEASGAQEAVVNANEDVQKAQKDGSGAKAEADSEDPTPAPEPPEPELTFPPQQQAFLDALDEAKTEYNEAPNELKKSAVRRNRKSKIKKVLKGKKAIKNWVGVISELGTTGDGNAYLTVKIPESDASIQTWNNEFSDISSNTLIGPRSSLYEAVSDLSTGQKVRFSGTFRSGRLDFVHEASLSEYGSMDEPEFIFKFTSVEPL